MGFDSTITEQDLDATSTRFVRELRQDAGEHEPDFAVDGLRASFTSRIIGMFSKGRS